MIKKIGLLFCVTLFAVPSLAAAQSDTTDQADKGPVQWQEPDTRHYIGGEISWLKLDDDRNVKDSGAGVSVYYGRQLSEHIWWESALGYYRLPTESPVSDDFSQYHLMTGLSYAFGDRKHFTPYVIAQIGAIKHDVLPSADEDTNMGLNAGVGFVTAPLFDNGLRLRADARYVVDTFDGARATQSTGDGSFGDIRLSLGIEIPLGMSRVVVKKEVKTIVKKIKVPVKVEVEVIDTDGDGVPDKRDDCANTPSGARVDAKGCLIANQRLVLRNILFETGSAKLTKSSEESLNKLADALQKQEEIQIEVSGYTDSRGSDRFNKALSKRRAQSVVDYLLQQGVSSSRLTATGYGEADPIASNNTVSGRALNRRVELHLSE